MIPDGIDCRFFVCFTSRSDLLILKTIKQTIEMRNSVCHSATIYSNALMHAGTTVDTFLRENLVRSKMLPLAVSYFQKREICPLNLMWFSFLRKRRSSG